MKKRKKNLNIFGANLEWATAHLYYKKKKILYCNLERSGLELYCSLGRKVCCNIRILGSIVLQYSGMDGLKVYCNTLVSIAGWEA